MQEFIQPLLIYIVLPTILGVITWFVRTVLQRLDTVEKKLHYKVDENQVRILLADKVDPIREDIDDLKFKLDKIIDLLLKKS